MIKAMSSMCFAASFVVCLAVAPAQAQLARTFVSSTGNDANDCQRLTPCRTFQGAHDKTLASGEITVLDPGGYGAVTITKAISIINDGVGEAGTLVSGGSNGITISAGVDDSINLRGLTIKGIGFGGGNGIRFNSGRSLTVENCTIRSLSGAAGASGNGMVFAATASSSLAMSNTVVTDNAFLGILILPTGSGTVKAVFSRVELYNNGSDALLITGHGSTGTIKATVVDSIASNNGEIGFQTSSATGQAVASLMLVRSVSANNLVGLRASSLNGGNSTIVVGQSTVTGNAFSWQAPNGVVKSYGDNNIDGNGDGDPTPPVIPKK